MDERRKIPRRRILKSGKILLGRREVLCTVRNLSKIGACLVVQTTYGIPATFEFVMPDQLPKSCKVMWRDDTRLGWAFTFDRREWPSFRHYWHLVNCRMSFPILPAVISAPKPLVPNGLSKFPANREKNRDFYHPPTTTSATTKIHGLSRTQTTEPTYEQGIERRRAPHYSIVEAEPGKATTVNAPRRPA
jgi:PilZ domain